MKLLIDILFLFLNLFVNLHIPVNKEWEYKGPEASSGDSICFVLHNKSQTDLFIRTAAEMKTGHETVTVTDDIFASFASQSQLHILIKAGASDTLIWKPGNINLLNPGSFKYESVQKGEFRLVFFYGPSLNESDKVFKTGFFRWQKK